MCSLFFHPLRCPIDLAFSACRALTAGNKAIEDIYNNMVVAMIRKVNESTLKIPNRRDNGEDGKTENTQR